MAHLSFSHLAATLNHLQRRAVSARGGVSLALCLICIGYGAAAQADIHMYKDERGVVHFTNIPDADKRFKILRPEDQPERADTSSPKAAVAPKRIPGGESSRLSGNSGTPRSTPSPMEDSADSNPPEQALAAPLELDAKPIAAEPKCGTGESSSECPVSNESSLQMSSVSRVLESRFGIGQTESGGDQTALRIIEAAISILFTWCVGLVPPVLIRHVIVRRPIGRLPALGIVGFFFAMNFYVFVAILGSRNRTHAVWLLVAWVSYWLLTRIRKENTPHADQGSGGDEVFADKKGGWPMLTRVNSRWAAGLGIAVAVIGVSVFLLWPRGQPRDFDECILANMKGVSSDMAAKLIYRSCRDKF